MRAVLVDNNKNFPAKKDEFLKGKLGIISYREKGASDKNELDDELEAMSNLVLYKEDNYIEENSNEE
jgi:hypothetical protein